MTTLPSAELATPTIGAHGQRSVRPTTSLSRQGKGKTTHIRGILERGERSLILTHGTTLTGDIHANCKHTTHQFKHYALDFPSRESKSLMDGANKLICQLESIRYLDGAAPYTYLRIDESLVLCI